MHRYFHSGLRIASDIALPEWAAFACEGAHPVDVTIALSEQPPPDLPADGSTIVTGDKAGFAIAGVGGFLVDRGERMTLYPALAAEPAELRLFTLGSAWGLLGYQRGHAMWHGSVVERRGRAVLFCGDAGEGKSTMAAAMVAAGARLVGDDLNRVAPEGAGAFVYPSSSRIKLWREAVEHFGWQDRVIGRDLMREDKFLCDPGSSHAGGPAVPLVATIVLSSGNAMKVEHLSGGDALAAVLRGTLYRPDALEAMGRWAEQGALAARIIAHTQVYRLTRPRDLDAIGECVDSVLEKLERIG